MGKDKSIVMMNIGVGEIYMEKGQEVIIDSCKNYEYKEVIV